MGSQIKFYKGMNNTQAFAGTNKSNETVNDGAILFSDGEIDSSKSKRIYTKESKKDANDQTVVDVVEYYKEDLEFLTEKKLATTVGLKEMGTTIPRGTRLIELIKDLLFVTYLPKYTGPSASVGVTATTSKNNGDYVTVGTTVTVSNALITITGNTPTAKSQLGSTSYTARGGDVSKIKIAKKTGNSYKDSNNNTLSPDENTETINKVVYDVINDTDNISINTVKIDTVAADDVTVNSVGATTVNYVKADNLPSYKITFDKGTENSVKDTDGHLTTETASNYITKPGNGSTGKVGNDYSINTSEVEGTVSNDNITVYGYLPIYYKSETGLTIGADGEVPPATISEYTTNALFFDNGGNFTTTGSTSWSNTFVIYTLETGNTNTQQIIRVIMPKKQTVVSGENTAIIGNKIQFLLPSGVEIDNTYAKVADPQEKTLSIDLATSYTCRKANNNKYYRKKDTGVFYTEKLQNTQDSDYNEYYVWEIVNGRDDAALGSHYVLFKFIKK